MHYAITLIDKDGDTVKMSLTSTKFRILTDAIIAHSKQGFRDGWTRIANDGGYGLIVECGTVSKE